MSERRVVITGLGAVSAAGLGAQPLMDALCAGKSFTRRIVGFDPSGFACHVAGEVTDFSARDFVPKSYRKAVKVMARDIELAVAAADLAMRDAQLATKGTDDSRVDIEPARFACNIGAGLICADLDELGSALQTALDEQGNFDLRRWGAEGMNNLTPLWLLKYLPNMLACHVTIIHDLRGPSNTITCGEASSHLSVGEAWHQIQRGSADWAIAGGAESKLNPMGLLRQGKLGRLANRYNDRPEAACRPFDADADGTIIGEGGGLVVLETLDSARKRGAKIYAEIVGFGSAADPAGLRPGAPQCGNVHLAARKAMKEAGVSGDQLDLVVPHGTGVPAEDQAEAAAIREVLGQADAAVVPLTGAVGDCFAGGGGLGLAVGAMAIAADTIPAAVNCAAPADGCGLNLPGQAQRRAVNCVLTQAFSHAGQSAAIVLKKYQA